LKEIKIHTDSETRIIRRASANITFLCRYVENGKGFVEGLKSNLKLLSGIKPVAVEV